MTVALGVMQIPVPVAGDNLPAYETGALRDGGLWTALRRLSDHDHSGGEMGGPVAGGGGTGVDVTITGTEGVTVVEAPANTFALGLTASPDANNTIVIRANGIYSAAGAIPPEYVTDSELATALGPYATDADLVDHAGAADPHPTYSTAAEVATAITAHEGLANPHPTYATDADLTAHAGAADPHPTYTTATELSTAITTHAGLADPHPTYLTAAEGNALYRPIAYVTDVTITPDASLTATESPANTFALAARLSPDGGNALALRANGLYATVPGGSGLPTTGGTMTGSIAVGTTNLYDLGATATRWRKLWATDVETTNVPTIGGVSMDSRYALATALTALTTRVATLEAQVATLNTRMAGHTHTSGTIDTMGGTAVLP